VEQNAAALRDTLQAHEAMEHLRGLQAEAKAAKRQIDKAAENSPVPRTTTGPGMSS
jgi:hypothetical protein